MPKTDRPSAIVVGASSGIGAACVRELARRGYSVAALARRKEELDRLAGDSEGRVTAYVHDVKDLASVPPLFERIAKEAGGVSMFLYAAGVMPRIDASTYDTAKDEDVIATNLTGAIAWMNAAAPHFAAKKSGAIVGISSIAGDRGRRGFPAYCTSKAALNTFLESLRNRLRVQGVTVTTIKPGYIDTQMTKGLPKLFWLASPEQAARQIVDAAESGANVRYVLRRWALVGFIIRSIPSFIFRRLSI